MTGILRAVVPDESDKFSTCESCTVDYSAAAADSTALGPNEVNPASTLRKRVDVRRGRVKRVRRDARTVTTDPRSGAERTVELAAAATSAATHEDQVNVGGLSSLAARHEMSWSGQYTSHELIKRASLEPNHTQKVTLGVIGAYVAIIAILWNVPYVHYILWPFKMLTVAFHEFGHAFTGVLTGAKIKSISLEPNEGGVTHMSGGSPAITLSAGYLGSAFIGACLITCGFNIVASKVCSFVLAVAFLLTLWWSRRDWLTILTIVFAVGLLVACWFIAHGAALRFYILFLGVMSSLYSVWDICDDLIFRKVNESDASVFAKRYGGSSACWGVIWCIVSLVFMIGGILIGLVAFKQSFSEQAASSQNFLPTRFL